MYAHVGTWKLDSGVDSARKSPIAISTTGQILIRLEHLGGDELSHVTAVLSLSKRILLSLNLFGGVHILRQVRIHNKVLHEIWFLSRNLALQGLLGLVGVLLLRP